MRILFLNTFSDPILIGGAEYTLRVIVEGMRARGHEVRVVSLLSDTVAAGVPPPDHTHRHRVRNLYTPDGETARSLPMKLAWHGIDLYNPIAARDIAGELRRFQPDVVSCHNLSGWSIAAWGAIERQGVPIVQVLHDYYLMCISSMRTKGQVPCQDTCGQCTLFRWPHKAQSRKVASVVGVSAYILRMFTERGFFPNATPRVIYDATKPVEVDASALPAPDHPVFGFIGRIAPHKGVEVALTAFAQADLPKTSQLLIAGDGEPGYLKQLKDSLTDPRVTFLGPQDPAAFFPRLSCTIMPSLSDEPLGRVVFESHGYGVPVLGSRRGGIPEMITPGENGYLFTAGDHQELRGLLERVSAPGQSWSRADIMRGAAIFFDTTRFLDEYEETYRLAGAAGHARVPKRVMPR